MPVESKVGESKEGAKLGLTLDKVIGDERESLFELEVMC